MSEIKSTTPDSDDRISDLPDSILGNILSFLPTNNAVATGILSKRWNRLWTLAGNLDFHCPRDYTGSVELFVQFVNYVLLFHKHGCFQRLSLTWRTGCIPFHVNIWIGVALDRDVSGLYVFADISNLPNQLQSSLFRSETLKSLELSCNICIPSSGIVFNLPRLERLELISVYFDSEKAIGKILKGCPVLKYLIIYMDVEKMVEHGYLVAIDNRVTLNADGNEIRCVLSSASLTHLDVSVNTFNSSPRHLKVSWSVELDVPSLHYLNLDGFLLTIRMQQESLAFLDEAFIEITGSLIGEQVLCDSLVQAFSAFRCAETLTLYDQVILGLSYATVKLNTKFNRLMKLEYGGLDTNNVPQNNNLNSNQEKHELVPKCLSKSLQTVSIDGYYGHRDDLAMIEYIIKHASVHEIMQIGFKQSVHADFKRKYEMVQEICAFRRKSTVCEVECLDSW